MVYVAGGMSLQTIEILLLTSQLPTTPFWALWWTRWTTVVPIGMPTSISCSISIPTWTSCTVQPLYNATDRQSDRNRRPKNGRFKNLLLPCTTFTSYETIVPQFLGETPVRYFWLIYICDRLRYVRSFDMKLAPRIYREPFDLESPNLHGHPYRLFYPF